MSLSAHIILYTCILNMHVSVKRRKSQHVVNQVNYIVCDLQNYMVNRLVLGS